MSIHQVLRHVVPSAQILIARCRTTIRVIREIRGKKDWRSGNLGTELTADFADDRSQASFLRWNQIGPFT